MDGTRQQKCYLKKIVLKKDEGEEGEEGDDAEEGEVDETKKKKKKAEGGRWLLLVEDVPFC